MNAYKLSSTLYGFRGRVELVQEDDPAVLSFRYRGVLKGEHVEGLELGDATFEHGQTSEVFRGTGRETDVEKLHAVYLGNGFDDGRLAHPR